MEIILFSGIQASGKSTFYINNFFQTHLHISLDVLKTRRRENALIDTCFKFGQRFVVDNTNPTVEERRIYIEGAKEANFSVFGYYFDADLEECLKRNSLREGKKCISEVGVRSTSAKLIVPSYSEGFDKLFKVRIIKNQFFTEESNIEELNNEV